VGSDECMGYACGGAKVATRWWIEWEGRMYGAAHIAIVDDRAYVPVCPPRKWMRPRYTTSVHLKKVERTRWFMVYHAGEKDEEHEKESAGGEEEGEQGEERSAGHLDVCSGVMGDRR